MNICKQICDIFLINCIFGYWEDSLISIVLSMTTKRLEFISSVSKPNTKHDGPHCNLSIEKGKKGRSLKFIGRHCNEITKFPFW